MLREVCLGIHSMCVGSESKYFNGHTNIVDDMFICFGVRGLMDTNERLRNAMLFNILSYMSNALICIGDTVAAIDELYMFLSNLTTIEYIRNAMKRVRKRDSIMVLASQNIEDFLIPSIREFTKPLFSIPTHQFLFYPGQINPREYMDALQVEDAGGLFFAGVRGHGIRGPIPESGHTHHPFVLPEGNGLVGGTVCFVLRGNRSVMFLESSAGWKR